MVLYLQPILYVARFRADPGQPGLFSQALPIYATLERAIDLW